MLRHLRTRQTASSVARVDRFLSGVVEAVELLLSGVLIWGPLLLGVLLYVFLK